MAATALGIVSADTAVGDLIGDIAYNAYTIQNTSALNEEIAEDSGQGLEALQTSLDSLANQVMDKSVTLDYLLAEQGGVRALANTSCCFYVNTSSEAEVRVHKLLQKAKRLRDTRTQLTGEIWKTLKGDLSFITWFLLLPGSIVSFLLLFIFGPRLLNCLAKFVSSHLEANKVDDFPTRIQLYTDPSSPGYHLWRLSSLWLLNLQ